MPDAYLRPPSSKAFWRRLRRHRFKFLPPAFLIAAAVLIVGLILPRQYDSRATFERRVQAATAPASDREPGWSAAAVRPIRTEDIAGDAAIDRLMASLKQDASSGYTSLGPEAAGSLRGDRSRGLEVHHDLASPAWDRVTLRYVSTNPALARAAVNLAAGNYIAAERAALAARLDQTLAFLSAEAEEERKTVRGLEEQLAAFEVAHADLLPEGGNTAQTTRMQLQNQAWEVEEKAGAAELRTAAIEKVLAATTATTPTTVTAANPDYARKQGELHDLKTQLAADLDRRKMTEKHPDVIALRVEIARAQADLDHTPPEFVTEKQSGPNPVRAEVELALATARADRDAYDKELATVRDRLAAASVQAASAFGTQAGYRKLARDAEEHQKQLAFWDENLRSFKTMTASSDQATIGGVRFDLIEPCGPLLVPAWPDALVVLLLAAGLGLIAGVARVALAMRADRSFASGPDLAEAARLPLLGVVGNLTSARGQRYRWVRDHLLYPLNAILMGGALALLVAALYLSLQRPDTFQQLTRQSTRLLLNHFSSAPRTATTRD